ncbi:MAG: hypothetical protein AB8B59_09425 [Maribacter sp.]
MMIFLFLSLGVTTQNASGQDSTKNGMHQWKEGFIILKDGARYFGEVRCFVRSGALSGQIEFRKDATDFSQTFLVNTCDFVQWGDLELTSLPNTTRKNPFDKLFCMTSFVGNTISLYFEPKFTKSSKPKSMRFIVLKEGVFTSVTKINFKRKMSSLFSGSAIWKQKATDKQWFSYANIYEVVKFYEDNIILVSTDFED